MTTPEEWQALFDEVREAWKQASAGFFVQGMSQAQIDALAGIAINVIRTKPTGREMTDE